MRSLLLVAGAGSSFVAPEAPPASLSPSSTIGISRSGSNPTFNFNTLTENQILVGSTYWCAHQPGLEGSISLASSPSPDGPWTDAGVKVTGTQIYAPFLMEDAGTFYLFYASDSGVGGDGKIYCATASSVNGTYTKYPNNTTPTAMLSPGSSGAWDDFRVGEPSIVKDGSTYYMLYMGEKTAYQTTERIGLATASSLTGTWTKDAGNPVLLPGTSGAWDDFMVADAELFKVGSDWWMWYSGFGGPTASDFPWSAGLAYASAPDGPWTRHADNPIISGSGSGFDLNGAFRGAIYVDDDGYHVTYTGVPSGSPNLATMKGGNAVLVIS